MSGKSIHTLSNGLKFRPFASQGGDLDIHFGESRPQLITHILQACCQSPENPGAEVFRVLPVTRRMELLFEVLLSSGQGELIVALPCPDARCGQIREFGISREDLPASPADKTEVTLAGQVCSLRKPTGCDQEQWAAKQYPDASASLRDMLQSLLDQTGKKILRVQSGSAQDWILAAGQALEQLDPLMVFQLHVTCPHCSQTARQVVDLEQEILHALQGLQQQLLAEIHTLALGYHWSEQAIMALPAWRRKQYLNLLESRQSA